MAFKTQEEAFSLKPFEKGPSTQVIELKGFIARRVDALFVRYEIIGNLPEIDIPGREQDPFREKGLWETTCLELFAAVKDSDRYWEFNFSPSGNWNVFRFEHYRNERCADKLREEPLFASFPINIQKRPGSFLLDVEFDPDKIINKDQLLDIGISAIIRSGSSKSYWALAHCGTVPDFHRRDSFIIEL